MFTIRCCNAWKFEIATPNCWRCLVYSIVSASTLRNMPTASATVAAVASSSAASMSGHA
ncbi:Uncharacterised protein [Mycobacteroides abscessus subsp. abscessus]|nr:Uncharacterised protein [Mycobacteroides abscessus subsp. abscessus]